MTALLILIPVLLLTLSSLGIAILRQTRPSIGYAWLWAVLAALASAGLVLALRWQVPLEVTIHQWEPFDRSSLVLDFILDRVSWPYAFALSAVLVAVLLTDSARLQSDAGPLTWIFSLLITGLGMLAILAGGPVTLILTWTAIDLAELVGVFSTRVGRWMSQPMIISFAVRVTGTLLVMAALLLSAAWGIEFAFTPIPSRLAVIMLLAAGLRLGVLPLNLPFIREVYSWRGLGNLVRLVGPASSLVVLGRMPVDAVPAEWQTVFLFFSALAALYGSAMWLAANPAQNARVYWVIALAGLAVASVARGSAHSSLAWGCALLLTGSVLFLYSAQNRPVSVISLIAVIGVTGLPFTPAAHGWEGVIGPAFDLYSLAFILAVFMLCLGFVRRALVAREELYRMERWIHTIYPAGLVILILSQWVIVLAGWREGFFSVGVWWASALVVLPAILSGLLIHARQSAFSAEAVDRNWLGAFARRVGSGLAAFFRLNWLYGFLAWVYELAEDFIQLLTAMFEGDGGVLWTVVLLVLLISLLSSGGTP